MKSDEIMVTNRDLEIIELVGRFGMMNIEHIRIAFDLSIPRSYQIMSKIGKLGYLKTQRILHADMAIYTLTKKASIEFGFKEHKHVSLGSYKHDILSTKYCLILSKKYNCKYLTEKELRASFQIGDKGHTPDFKLLNNGKSIAVEVELTLKGKRRIESILKFYKTCLDYSEIIYICSKETINVFEKFTKNLDFISVYDKKEFLNDNR